MREQSLNGRWELSFNGQSCTGTVPGSVYSFLLEAGRMEDPYFGENELAALALMENDFEFRRSFVPGKALSGCGQVLLRCEGLDTLCAVTLNGRPVGRADNMHRVWEFDVTALLRPGGNELALRFESPVRYIREKNAEDYVGGMADAMEGFPHIRKAHYMFGWDWGPRLPDAGIWRSIALVGVNGARITDVHITQRHEEGAVLLHTRVCRQGRAGEVRVRVTLPTGETRQAGPDGTLRIENPLLWWPRGCGAQPLYRVTAELLVGGRVADSQTRRVGLRTLTVVREKDEWGESFDVCVNGLRIFAMGANIIPEDNLLSRVSETRTRLLLRRCADANYNMVRVWGGGYYPGGCFYDACDELGLLVWQDFMFACANYRLTPEFEENIRAELADNIRRIRGHACLALWCGNNEMEMFQARGAYGGTPKTRADYIRMFEHVIPEVLRREDPATFYWPASPSSGGGFDAPGDPSRGNVHAWDVWHERMPFAAYRAETPRFVSEFGFQSFPCLATVESFTEPGERNIFARAMERHQRQSGANGRIMEYLSAAFLYPSGLDALLYASQLLQAEAVRCGVEHWRRNRGRCMGAVYWQANDCWPAASWASMDYFGRWKALHYYAKRFFAPVMLSCEETGELTGRLAITDEPRPAPCAARLAVANETPAPVRGRVSWALRESGGRVLARGEQELCVPALSALWMERLEFPGINCLESYLSCRFETDGGEVSRSGALFTAPKHFRFLPPGLSYTAEAGAVTVRAENYARGVEISSPDGDILLSDNYFDLDGGESYTVRVLEGSYKTLRLRSVYDIR